MNTRRNTPFGHTAPILRGVWARITTMGVLRRWYHLHLVAWLAVVILLVFGGNWRWLPLPLVGWVVGSAILAALTRWNPQWDAMFVAQMREQYRDYYDAG